MANILTPEAAARALRAVALPDICRVEDLALPMGLTAGAVRKLLREGRLPGRRVGRRWLVARPALLEWLSVDPRPRSSWRPGRSRRGGVR